LRGVVLNDVENEMRAVKKLCCQDTQINIVEVLKYGTIPDPDAAEPCHFIDMNLCDLNLYGYIYFDPNKQHVGRKPPPPFVVRGTSPSMREIQLWDIMRQICAGIEFVHSHDEVHRDLKPSNGNARV
jgi:serine/threonine protein kinase